MTLKGKKLALIGGGNMGEVLIEGIISNELMLPEDIKVSDISGKRLRHLESIFGVKTLADNEGAVKDADIIILAVKPQIMDTVLKDLSSAVEETKLVISIAAGITTSFIEERLKPGIHVIRIMPNSPALIGEGASALAAGSHASVKDVQLVRSIFDAVGVTAVVEERLMDAVTGLSGSGPAYAFIIIEAMADAGVLMGLPRETALKLSAQTMMGAAKLCLSGERHPAELKDMVTSPGGTTIAGIQALERGGLRKTIMAAVEAATLRSKELGKIS